MNAQSASFVTKTNFLDSLTRSWVQCTSLECGKWMHDYCVSSDEDCDGLYVWHYISVANHCYALLI